MKNKIADKGNRVGNLIVDSIIILITYALIALLLNFCFPEGYIEYEFLLFIIGFLYYLLAESIYGKTVGKIITKTSVVDKFNNKPAFWRIFIRTSLRFVLIDCFTFLFSVKGFHDLFSGTYVVKR